MGANQNRIITTLFVFYLSGCSLFHAKTMESPITTLKPPVHEARSGGEPGCLEMIDDYCDSLYTPGSEGNLIIHKKKGTPIHILQGKTRNGLHQVFAELAQSKIRNQEYFPKDFLTILRAHRYFQRLENILHREPFERMNLTDRIEAAEDEAEADHIWTLAIKDALILRLTARFPEYPKTPYDLQPPEMQHFEVMERRILLASIASATWRDHPNWARVTYQFEKLRKSYLDVIAKLPIPGALKAQWSSRIRSVSLVLPGSIPEIMDQDCSTTTINAFYFSTHNVITVCAGDFNSEEILLTLTHEMSHALDNDRSLYLFFKESTISKGLENLNRQMCLSATKKISCPDWKHLKEIRNQGLAELSRYQPALPALFRCLKKDPTSRALDEDAAKHYAMLAVKDRIRKLADEEAFIRLTQPKLPLSNGRRVLNPSYLNPCHYLQTAWTTEDLNGELSFLTAFTAEYTCSEIPDPADRLKESLNFTQHFFEGVETSMILSEGEFSERKALIEDDYASPSSERFADFMGSRVMAEHLKEVQSLWDRRMTFLASNSWQCPGPSLSTEFPKETAILRRYLLDSHTDGDDRKKEILSSPIREVLACEPDFDWNECSFPELIH